MRFLRKSWLLLVAACIVLGLGACERGPLEKGGKKADDAIKDVTK
jgi:hypothetical protein